jgi:hypothetical protein
LLAWKTLESRRQGKDKLKYHMQNKVIRPALEISTINSDNAKQVGAE